MAVAVAHGVAGHSITREKRLELLIAGAGGVTRVAEVLNVTRATLHNWTKPDAKLPLAEMEKLAQLGGVSLDWIASGYDRRPDLGSLSASGMTVLYRYEAGPKNQLIEIVDSGGDVAFRDEWMTRIGIQPRNAALMVLNGDAMAPTIPDGATLIVDRAVTSISGAGLYALVIGREITVRRAQMLRDGSVKLSSDNARYEPELVPVADVQQMRVAGRVRAAIIPL